MANNALHQTLSPAIIDDHKRVDMIIAKANEIKPLPLALSILVVCSADIWMYFVWLHFRQHLLTLPYGTRVRFDHLAAPCILAEAAGALIGLPLFLKGMSLAGPQSFLRYGLSFIGILLCFSPLPFLFLCLISYRNTNGITLY